VKHLRFICLVLMLFSLSGCGYNAIQASDEAVNAAWSEVLNQYQRRADLVPNLVNAVKGYATHEQRVLVEVSNARAKAGSIQMDTDLASNPEAFARFQRAQGELSSALSRLMSISERYPELKANDLFRDLQAQLEGTENRIAVARGRYIKAVQNYNMRIRQFPGNVFARLFDYRVKPNFSVDNERAISVAPTVDFSGVSPAPVPGSEH
jgi:LemA protein